MSKSFHNEIGKSSQAPNRDMSLSGNLWASILQLRERELALYSKNQNSPLALRLSSIRGEFQCLLDGQPVRIAVVERALLPTTYDSQSAAHSDVSQSNPMEVGVGG